MTAFVLALALAAAPEPAGLRSQLSPAPVGLYRVVWQRPFVEVRPLETNPQEHGGVAVDPQRGIAFLGTSDGWFHAVRRDGSIVWEVQAGGGFGQPAVDGDTVYVGSADGRLYAVAIPTGKVRWTYEAREDLSTRPVVLGGLVMVASLQDTVYGIDAATGAWRWHHRRERKGGEAFTIFGSASVQASDGTAYAAYSDGFVVALDAKTGVPRWERRVAPAGAQLDVDGLALEGDRVYAAAYSGAVVALDRRSGQPAWTFQAPAASQLALAPGLVVAVTSQSVIGLSRATGAALWTTPLAGSPGGAPVLAGKWLLVPAGKGGLRWLEPASGRVLRVLDGGTGVLASPGVAGARVYVLSNGGDLLALDLG